MAWLTSPAWVALFLRATGSDGAVFAKGEAVQEFFVKPIRLRIPKQASAMWR